MWNWIAGIGILGVPIVLSYAIGNFWSAASASAAILTVFVHVTSYFGAGYFDPFFAISLPVGAIVFFGWSGLIIWVLRRMRFRRRP